MSSGLSPHIEQKIADAVASGLYPSREALIETGVERLLDAQIAFVPDHDMTAVETAIESSAAGRSAPMTTQDWEELHKMVAEIAAGKNAPLE